MTYNITKKNTEKCIQDTDNLVKACCEKVGQFTWDGQRLTEKWAELRRGLARIAANTLVGNYKNDKMTVQGYSSEAVPMEVNPAVKAKSIELNKSEEGKTPIVLTEQKLIIKI